MTQSNKNPWLIAFGASAALALLYISHLSSQYNFDGTMYALYLAQAVFSDQFGGLIHPHHMLYGPLSFVFYKSMSGLGASISVMSSLQLLDVLLSFFTLWLFQVFCFELTGNKFLSVVATLLLGFSFGFWYMAIEPRNNMLFTFTLLFGLYFLWKLTAPDSRIGWRLGTLALGALGALAILGHIAGGFFLAPIGWGAFRYLRPKSEPSSFQSKIRAGLPPLILVNLVAFILLTLPYLIGYHIHPLGRDRSFIDWVTVEANPDTTMGARNSYWLLNLSSLQYGLNAFYESILAAGNKIHAHFPGQAPIGILGVAGCISGIILYIVFLPTLMRKDMRTHLLLILTIIPLALFTAIFANIYLNIALLPLIWLAVAAAHAQLFEKIKSQRYRISVGAALIIFVVSLFTFNFFSSIRPGSDPEINIDLQKAYFVRDNTPENAVIYMAGVTEGYNIGKVYIVYFAGRQTRVLDWIFSRKTLPFPQSLEESLYNDRDRPVYVLSEVLNPGPTLDQLAANHRLSVMEIKSAFNAYSPKPVASMGNFGLYRLEFNRQTTNPAR